jgi:lipid II:glycine glycyltransferase (peptidoglycan interpeptide bridge formation enzyme)
LRPLEPLPWDGISSFERYYCHFLDLRPSLDEIRRKFHPDCVRRKIRRAEREKLVVEAGKSDDMINQFYVLQVITRRKHGLPPQPKQWFRNLMTEMGDAAVIRIARFQGNPIAAILTLCHQKTEIYKYGCSLADENNRGGMQILFWKMIEEAKLQGMELVDLGRCDIEDESLALFKERWGAERREMIYVRHPAAQPKAMRKSTLMTRLPKPVLIAAGRVLYRHMG